MKINELLGEFNIWVTNEEVEILKTLKEPIRLSRLSEHDQFKIQAMIRKSLVIKKGMEDPIVVANEKYQN
jgi:hypothetical protein